MALALLLARVEAAETLRVATYNVQNYTRADRRVPDGFRPEYPKPESEKAALRAVIRKLDADVLALQEMGGPEYLAELRRDLAAEGMSYPYGEAMMAADAERGLAVLSRVPLGAVTGHRDLRAKWREAEEDAAVRRGLLQVDVPMAGGVVTLFVVHLKSRLAAERDDPQAEGQRLAEAQAVRNRVLEIYPEPSRARFMLLGDFNDVPGSRVLQAIEARGKTQIAVWQDAADSRGHRWTHAYARQAVYSRFDQIFVSAGMSDLVGRCWIADGPTVDAASDHRPVVVELRPGRD